MWLTIKPEYMTSNNNPCKSCHHSNAALNNSKTKKKRMQFSQKQCVYADLLVAFVLILDFILKWNGKEGMSDVAISVVSMFGGFATAGYFALSGTRDCSKNKYGVKMEGE